MPKPFQTQFKKCEKNFRLKFWIDGPACFVVAIVGIVVNVVAVIVMAKKRVNKTFHLLMINLSCWDFCYLVRILQHRSFTFTELTEITMGMNKEGVIRITNYQTNFGTSGGLVVGNRRLMTLSPRFSYLETFWVEPTVEDVFFKRQVQEAQTMKEK